MCCLGNRDRRDLDSFPTRRSSDLRELAEEVDLVCGRLDLLVDLHTTPGCSDERIRIFLARSEEHTSELQSPEKLVCRLLLEKKKTGTVRYTTSNETGPRT